MRGYYAGVQPRFPAPVGFEGVGRVDALGPQVAVRCLDSASVVAQWAGRATGLTIPWCPPSICFPVPDDLPDEQIASFLINPASALMMLRHVLAIPPGEWLLRSAAGSELGRMIIRLAKRDGIRTIDVVRHRVSAAELEHLGADAVVVSTEGPIDEQVRRIVGPEGVKYAIDPVVGETGTQMYQALGEDGRMLVYGSLTGEPIRVGADPRYILAGRRILEVFWLGYWFPRLEASARRQLVQDIVTLMREGVLVTSAAQPFGLDEIGAAVTQAEATGRQGKVLLVPQNRT